MCFTTCCTTIILFTYSVKDNNCLLWPNHYYLFSLSNHYLSLSITKSGDLFLKSCCTFLFLVLSISRTGEKPYLDLESNNASTTEHSLSRNYEPQSTAAPADTSTETTEKGDLTNHLQNKTQNLLKLKTVKV